MRNCSLLIFLVQVFTSYSAALAQQPPGSALQPLSLTPMTTLWEGATVSLLFLRVSPIVETVLTPKEGTFSFAAVTSGRYLLTISFAGFRPYRSDGLNISTDSSTLRLNPIWLSPENGSLQQVTVTAKRPMIEIKPDRTVVKVEASVTNTGATALEVLEKLPGVAVDKEGRISLKGKQGVTMMIDGKPGYLSGTDLTNLLSTMSANQLDQIEIMPNPASKYDAAGNSDVINIKMMKNRSTDFNGSISLAYGQGRYFETNNSVNLNYRNKTYNLFLNYSTNTGKGFNDLHIMRSYTGADGKTPLAFFDQPLPDEQRQEQQPQSGHRLSPVRENNAGLRLHRFYLSPHDT